MVERRRWWKRRRRCCKLRRKAERVAIEKEAAARLASQKVERLAKLGAAPEKAKVKERERLQMEKKSIGCATVSQLSEGLG